MCMRTEDCELQKRVDSIDARVTNLEDTVGKMRDETREGFTAITTAVNNLGHDFGERMTLIEARVVGEKERWGATLREIVKWTARVVLLGCTVAMGVTAYKAIFLN